MKMTRVLDFVPTGATRARPVEVSIGLPAQDGDGIWWALLEVVGFDDPYSKQIPGADAIQAVLAAAGIAPHLIAAMAKGGRVTLEGSDDLGFHLVGANQG